MQLFKVLYYEEPYIYIEILETGEVRKIHIKDFADFQLRYMEV